MASATWEDMISLNSQSEIAPNALLPAAHYVSQDCGEVTWDRSRISLESALSADNAPLPTTEQREGYYGANHFNYWASGLRDYCQLLDWLDANSIARGALLDIGCASGRLIRHVHGQADFNKVTGCDINRAHVDWMGLHLPSTICAFQNTSLPTLPLPDSSVDVITAFSVFTHIECFDTTWLMEFRRILRPGGIAWLTIHGDRTWRDIAPTWPLHAALTAHPDYPGYASSRVLPKERLVFRWLSERSYSANVFYRETYIRRVWGRILPFRDIFPALPFFQDIVVLQKPH